MTITSQPRPRTAAWLTLAFTTIPGAYEHVTQNAPGTFDWARGYTVEQTVASLRKARQINMACGMVEEYWMVGVYAAGVQAGVAMRTPQVYVASDQSAQKAHQEVAIATRQGGELRGVGDLKSEQAHAAIVKPFL